MAKALDGRQVVPLEEVVLAHAYQLEALMNVLERHGLLKKAEVLAEVHQLRREAVQVRWQVYNADAFQECVAEVYDRLRPDSPRGVGNGRRA